MILELLALVWWEICLWIVFSLVVYAATCALNRLAEIKKLPPGPWGIPITGYLTFMNKDPKHMQYVAMSAKYGPIFSAMLGNQLTVVINDHRIIRDAFRREELTGRPDTPLMSTLEGYGIINSQGALWKEQRRFLLDKLRHFGMQFMGKNRDKMEGRINVEVVSLIDMFKSIAGTPVDMSPYLAVAVSNVICNMMMSSRFSYEDPRFKRYTNLIEEGMRLFGQIYASDYIPHCKYLPGNEETRAKIKQNRLDMFEFYQEVIDDHRVKFDPNSIRDLVDFYLDELRKAKEEGRVLYEEKDPDCQIKQVIGDLFSAGMETIKTTLLWLMVFMLRNPEALKKVQEELDLVVGRERLPKIEDLHYLPVTETTIMEALRRSSIVPLGTTHSPTSDVTLSGYKIPAGCQVVPLIYGVHMDPNLWEEPEKFMPERFIDNSGNIRKPEYFMPFGVGRRMCLGYILARMELFQFFSSLVHTFNISLPEGEPMPSLEGNPGVTLAPDSFKVILTPRTLHTKPTVPSTSTLLRNVGSH